MDRIKRIIVVLDDNKQTDIQDLEKEDYEAFLELVHRLRLAYIVIQGCNVVESF